MAAKHVPDKTVLIKGTTNNQRTQPTTPDAQLNFTKRFKATCFAIKNYIFLRHVIPENLDSEINNYSNKNFSLEMSSLSKGFWKSIVFPL